MSILNRCSLAEVAAVTMNRNRDDDVMNYDFELSDVKRKKTMAELLSMGLR